MVAGVRRRRPGSSRGRDCACRAEALVIGADSGVEHAAALGRHVDIAVGDFDSVSPAALAAAEAAGAEVLRHPPDKDATDLELALDLAVARGARRITVVGGHGGRFDHCLANALAARLGALRPHGRRRLVRRHLRPGGAPARATHRPHRLARHAARDRRTRSRCHDDRPALPAARRGAAPGLDARRQQRAPGAGGHGDRRCRHRPRHPTRCPRERPEMLSRPVCGRVLLTTVLVAAMLARDRRDARRRDEAEATTSRITLVTHDSFAVSRSVLAAFTRATGITVEGPADRRRRSRAEPGDPHQGRPDRRRALRRRQHLPVARARGRDLRALHLTRALARPLDVPARPDRARHTDRPRQRVHQLRQALVRPAPSRPARDAGRPRQGCLHAAPSSSRTRPPRHPAWRSSSRRSTASGTAAGCSTGSTCARTTSRS